VGAWISALFFRNRNLKDYIKQRYLDASALVKIFYKEDGSARMRKFFGAEVHFCATSICVIEAISVIKSKWKYDHISETEYLKATEDLLFETVEGRIEIDEIPLFSISGIEAVKKLAIKHSLDWSDALQLETIKRGKYSYFCDGSSSILITADNELAKAATSESIRTWNCLKEKTPEWI